MEGFVDSHILSVMYMYEVADILFLIKSVRNLTSSFKINNYITFYAGLSRLAKAHKLQHSYMVLTTSPDMYSYLNRIPQLWNSLPMINLKTTLLTQSKNKLIFLYVYKNQALQVLYLKPAPCLKLHKLSWIINLTKSAKIWYQQNQQPYGTIQNHTTQ